MRKKQRLLTVAVLALLISIAFLPAITQPVRSSQETGAGSGFTVFLPSILGDNQPGSGITPVPGSNPSPTPPPASIAFTFVSWADTKSSTSILASLANQVAALQPAFTLYIGDLENAGFTTTGITAWRTALDGNQNNGMFDRTFPVRGNHDTSNIAGWQAYFTSSENAAKIGATNFTALAKNLTYAFDYSNAYFISIDVSGDASLITPAQIAFLDSGLSGAEARGLTHAFLFFHGPIYPVSSHTSCLTRTCPTSAALVSLIQVLNKHSIVSAVFHGHEHVQSYVHIDNSRIPEITHPFEEFITGTAGAPLYTCSKTYRFDYCGEYNGFATIAVAGKSFTVQLYQQSQSAPVKTFRFTKP